MKKQTLTKLAAVALTCSFLISAQAPQQPQPVSNSSGDVADLLLKKREEVTQAYAQAVTNGDYDGWVKLFAANATIDDPDYGQAANSPTAGQGYFSDYFNQLQANHPDWTTPPQDLFINPNNPDVVAIHWLHPFTDQKNDKQKVEGVSIFRFVPKSEKIQSITKIYNQTPDQS